MNHSTKRCWSETCKGHTNIAYFYAEWINDGVPVEKPKVPVEFKRHENRGYFFLRIADFHGETIEFEDETCVFPECKLLHTPINANFWHFSLRWLFNGKELEKWTNGIKRRMKTSAKALIVEKAFFDEPYYQEIDKALYVD